MKKTYTKDNLAELGNDMYNVYFSYCDKQKYSLEDLHDLYIKLCEDVLSNSSKEYNTGYIKMKLGFMIQDRFKVANRGPEFMPLESLNNKDLLESSVSDNFSTENPNDPGFDADKATWAFSVAKSVARLFSKDEKEYAMCLDIIDYLEDPNFLLTVSDKKTAYRFCKAYGIRHAKNQAFFDRFVLALRIAFISLWEEQDKQEKNKNKKNGKLPKVNPAE